MRDTVSSVIVRGKVINFTLGAKGEYIGDKVNYFFPKDNTFRDLHIKW